MARAVRIESPAPVTCLRLAVDVDNLQLAVGCDRTVYLMKLGLPRPIAQLDGASTPVTALAMDKKCARVVAGCEGGSVRFWNVERGANAGSASPPCQRFNKDHRAAVLSVEYHPFSEFVMSAGRDTELKVWDMRQQRSLQTYKEHSSEVTCVLFTPDGKWSASGDASGAVLVHDLVSGRIIGDLRRHHAPITSLACHPGHCMLSVASADNHVTVWDVTDVQTLVLEYEDVAGGTKVSFSAQRLNVISDTKFQSLCTTSWTPQPVAESSGFGPGIVDCCSSPDAVVVASIRDGQAYVERRSLKAPPIVASLQPRSAATPGRAPAPVAVATAADPLPKANKTPTAPNPTTDNTPSRKTVAAASPPAAVTEILGASDALTTLLQRRATNLRMARNSFPRDPAVTFVQLRELVGDSTHYGAVVDSMWCLQQQRSKERLTIEHVPPLMAVVVAMLRMHAHAFTIVPCLKVARSTNNKFRVKIDEGLRAAKVAVGVDLSMESRIRLATEAQRALDEVVAVASQFSLLPDAVGEEARQTILELQR